MSWPNSFLTLFAICIRLGSSIGTSSPKMWWSVTEALFFWGISGVQLSWFALTVLVRTLTTLQIFLQGTRTSDQKVTYMLMLFVTSLYYMRKTTSTRAIVRNGWTILRNTKTIRQSKVWSTSAYTRIQLIDLASKPYKVSSTSSESCITVRKQTV